MPSWDDCYQPADVVVTAAQMQQLEAILFAAGMPVAALMEKVAGRIATWITQHYPRDRTPQVGFIIGPGHNGGDGLVVARELHHRGYQVVIWCPFERLKELTRQHRDYLAFLQVPIATDSTALLACDLIVDGAFGFGLGRPLTGALAAGIEQINGTAIPVVSIDLPSGLTTDTGTVLGTAIRASQTVCLGMWKLGLMQDGARPYVGDLHLLPFDIPATTIADVVGSTPIGIHLSAAIARRDLPLQRSIVAHKYTAGHLLLIAGSRQYMGAALLAGKGAIASGVGMLTLVVPASLRMMAVSQLPEALIIGAPETSTGAIADWPTNFTWEPYDVVACGPGLTLDAAPCLASVLECDRPLILDADGLNGLAQRSPLATLQKRSAPTLLTPHPGEFRRLFPDLLQTAATPSEAARMAAQQGQCTVILKGATTAIAHPDHPLWFNTNSTPALARGGSGDVLTGLLGGLAAQQCQRLANASEAFLVAARGGVWWHSQTGRSLAATRTVLGCAPSDLAAHLLPTLGTRYQASLPMPPGSADG